MVVHLLAASEDGIELDLVSTHLVLLSNEVPSVSSTIVAVFVVRGWNGITIGVVDCLV